MSTAALVGSALIDDIEFLLELWRTVEDSVPMQVSYLTASGAAQFAALNEWSTRLLLAVDRS